MGMKYVISEEDYCTVGISKSVRNAINLFAEYRGITKREALYRIIRSGLDVEMRRDPATKHKKGYIDPQTRERLLQFGKEMSEEGQ